MNNKFDELTKQMAQSVTRRAALKFGLGLAGMALAFFGLASKAKAGTYSGYCGVHNSGSLDHSGFTTYTGSCVNPLTCIGAASAECPPQGTLVKGSKPFSRLCGGLFGGLDERLKCSGTV